MARPPQFEREEDSRAALAAMKEAVRRLSPRDRSHLLAWLCIYFQDDGVMFSQISRRRQRIVLDAVEY